MDLGKLKGNALTPQSITTLGTLQEPDQEMN
jgi:hypothetical protein